MIMNIRFHQRLKAGLRAFRSGKGGNVAVLFALTFSVVAVLSGFAVDFQRTSSIKQRLQDMADQAALAGVGYNAVFDGTSYKYDAEKSKLAAQSMFEANLRSAGFGRDVTVTPTYLAVVDGASVKTTVNYAAEIKTMVAGMFGLGTMQVSGQAVSNSATPNYIDVIFVVDTSPSMLMGASEADQQKMLSMPDNCYLACHGEEAKYHNAGVVFRLDVVANALGSMIDDLKANSRMPQQYRITIYGFSNTLYTILDATTDLDLAKSTAIGIQAGEPEGTNTTRSLYQLAQTIPTGGDGSDSSQRQQFMLLFTDGTTNDLLRAYTSQGDLTFENNPDYTPFAPVMNPTGSGMARRWHTQGFNPQDCAPIKAKNTSIMTLNTPYVVRPGDPDPRTQFIKNTLLPDIQANLTACASRPEYAYVASDPVQIQDAARKLTSALLSSARITH
ncbi:MAG: hypothetical protein CGW95_09815 [Phenylobacterium zucineum]|nr:MAG: hypothetical protein CGW95_09815 [Phenylobacterium zucineum]